MNKYLLNSVEFNRTWHLLYNTNLLNEFELEVHNHLFDFFNKRERNSLGIVIPYSNNVAKYYFDKLVQIKLNILNDIENKYRDNFKQYFIHFLDVCLNEINGCN